MKLQEIRTIAKYFQIEPAGLSKNELIHKIQRMNDSYDCFATAYDGKCDKFCCLWRDECFAASKNMTKTLHYLHHYRSSRQ